MSGENSAVKRHQPEVMNRVFFSFLLAVGTRTSIATGYRSGIYRAWVHCCCCSILCISSDCETNIWWFKAIIPSSLQCMPFRPLTLFHFVWHFLSPFFLLFRWVFPQSLITESLSGCRRRRCMSPGWSTRPSLKWTGKERSDRRQQVNTRTGLEAARPPGY